MKVWHLAVGIGIMWLAAFMLPEQKAPQEDWIAVSANVERMTDVQLRVACYRNINTREVLGCVHVTEPPMQRMEYRL